MSTKTITAQAVGGQPRMFGTDEVTTVADIKEAMDLSSYQAAVNGDPR